MSRSEVVPDVTRPDRGPRPRHDPLSRPDPARRTVGVLTFHRCINYGSYWQARCLVEGLRARGHDAVILDHDSWRINRAEWTCALRPVLPTPVSWLDSARYAAKVLRFARARSAFRRSPRFPLEELDRMPRYDRVIVGSDEVWNPSHPWYGECRLFFGQGLRADRLVAYAASCGNRDENDGLPSELAAGLRDFSAVSVRDGNSRRIIGGAMGFEPDLVLDPCLLFSVPLEGRWRGPREPFVAVYGHNFSGPFAAEVRAWAAARGLRLLSIGYRNDWADVQWLTADPSDFAHAFARAQAVATNFFHGCVFALRNRKPFVCETMPYRENKIRGLLAMLGGEAHRVEGEPHRGRIATRLSEPPEPGTLDAIERYRTASNAYLDRALA